MPPSRPITDGPPPLTSHSRAPFGEYEYAADLSDHRWPSATDVSLQGSVWRVWIRSWPVRSQMALRCSVTDFRAPWVSVCLGGGVGYWSRILGVKSNWRMGMMVYLGRLFHIGYFTCQVQLVTYRSVLRLWEGLCFIHYTVDNFGRAIKHRLNFEHRPSSVGDRRGLLIAALPVSCVMENAPFSHGLNNEVLTMLSLSPPYLCNISLTWPDDIIRGHSGSNVLTSIDEARRHRTTLRTTLLPL